MRISKQILMIGLIGVTGCTQGPLLCSSGNSPAIQDELAFLLPDGCRNAEGVDDNLGSIQCDDGRSGFSFELGPSDKP